MIKKKKILKSIIHLTSKQDQKGKSGYYRLYAGRS